MYRVLLAIPLCLLPVRLMLAQAKVINPGFEQGEVGSVPVGWFLPPVAASAGFSAILVDQGCRTGARCAMITGVSNLPQSVFGNLIQSLPATGYTLRHIRLRAAIRVAQSDKGDHTRAQMWLRLDRADNTMAFLENMDSRP